MQELSRPSAVPLDSEQALHLVPRRDDEGEAERQQEREEEREAERREAPLPDSLPPGLPQQPLAPIFAADDVGVERERRV